MNKNILMLIFATTLVLIGGILLYLVGAEEKLQMMTAISAGLLQGIGLVVAAIFVDPAEFFNP